jgi:hypothetical protein
MNLFAMRAFDTFLLLADVKPWPDRIDSAAIVWYVAIAFGIPVLGYVCMVLDFRAYLRSLRRALVVVTGYRTELPEWMRKNTPRCILALGLVMPCTTEEVLAAYRRKVKELHPDHGGDKKAFLRLQAHFEEALAFVEGR